MAKHLLLSEELIASRVGSSSSVKRLQTAQWALNTYGVGAKQSGNIVIADPLCYGVFIYFSSPYTNNGSSGVSEWKCILKRNTSPAVLYHELKIIVPEGYGLPTEPNKNSMFGISMNFKNVSSPVFDFSVKMVGSSSYTTSTVAISNTNWVGTGGRVYITINSNGTISGASYFAPATEFINKAKTQMANGFNSDDLDCYYQTHILRT